MAKKESLRELLVVRIQTLYDVEQQLVKALPKMAEAATNPTLKQGFEEHLAETEEHVSRLENVFELLGEEPDTEKSEAVRGLVKDGEWLIKNIEEGPALDLALTAAGRSVEHYEMSDYIGAIEWADALEEDQISSLLQETLDEEEISEEKLSTAGEQLVSELVDEGDEDED